MLLVKMLLVETNFHSDWKGSVIGGQEVFHGWDENRTLYSQIVLNENDPIAWENIVQKRIQDELYASSQLEVDIALYLIWDSLTLQVYV